MFRRECPRCHKTGLVRAERVFKAGSSLTEFFCGACEYTWTERDGDEDEVVKKTETTQNKGYA
jgi:hypothetical protein